MENKEHLRNRPGEDVYIIRISEHSVASWMLSGKREESLGTRLKLTSQAPGMVADTYNPNAWEAEQEDHPGLHGQLKARLNYRETWSQKAKLTD